MPGWLRVLLGLGEGEIPAGGVTHFELAGMPGGLWAVLAALVVLGALALVVLVYRRESDLTLPQRLSLTGLRLLALGLVVLVLLNPRLRVEVQAQKKAETLFLVDGSGSMAHQDRYSEEDRGEVRRFSGLDIAGGSRGGRVSRAELVAHALAHLHLPERLGEKNRVRSFFFHEGITEVEPEDLYNTLQRSSLSGKSTWIGTALKEALEASRAQEVAAVVLVSDGRSNGGEPLEAASAELVARAIPVHAVAVGKVDLPRNIAVAELNAPELVEAGMPARLRVRVRGSGLPGEFELRLTRRRMGDRAAETVGVEKFALREAETEVLINFTDSLSRDGRFRYQAEVDGQEGEESLRDNRRTAEVAVVPEKCRMLLVAGGPSFQYRFLRTFFIRDPGIQVSLWLESADPTAPQDGDVPLKALPATEEALRPYDVVVLLDPDPDALPPGFGRALSSFVSEAGGGLAFVAGEHHTPTLSRSEEGHPILALLPVELGADPGHEHRTPWRPRLTPSGKMHTLCQFNQRPDQNDRLWSTLPRFYFRYPVAKLKPAASSLLEIDSSPVAAVHQAGAGRVLFLATDDLHRWRELDEEIHERFWSGAARYLALGKRLAGTRQLSLTTDRERYQIGDEVRVEAHVLDSSFQPLVSGRLTATLERNETAEDEEGASSGEEARAIRRELHLEAVPGRAGWFRGRWKAEDSGAYRIQATAPGTQAEGVPVAFVVARPSTEDQDPSPDLGLLEALATRTGGSFSALSGLTALAERIPDRTVVEVLGRKTRTLWDSATLLLLFSGALILEWVLRKKWRLS